MKDHEALRKVIEEFIGVMHLQTKELEKLLAHVEQVTGRLPDGGQLSVVASELSELHQRVKKLAGKS